MLTSLLQRAREARAAELGDGEGLEEGFTLIELMVVLLIIAILLAIAIPTFLGVTGSASDRAAQSNLTNALTEAKAVFQNTSNYVGDTPAVFAASAPEFGWISGTVNCATTSVNCISMETLDLAAANDGLGVTVATYSPKDNSCWYAVDLESNPATGVTATSPDVAFGTPTGATAAGVYYAELLSTANGGSIAGVTSSAVNTNCAAHYADTTSGFTWFSSYAAASKTPD